MATYLYEDENVMPGTTYQADDLLIFLHIMKTGGTTLRWSVEEQFAPSEIVRCYKVLGCDFEQDIRPRPDAWKRRIRLLSSHRGFGAHEYFPQEASYVTMLREPDSRAVSGYYHNVHFGRASYTLDYFIQNITELKHDSRQVRLLSDRWQADRVDESDLERAITRMRESFSAVGLTSRYNESMALFAKVYGWPHIAVVRRNSRKVRWSMDDLTDEQRVLLHDSNMLDHRLYAFAQQYFEQALETYAITPEFTARTVREDWVAQARVYINRLRQYSYQRRVGMGG